MNKKAFALILLVCLVASPFMLKLPAAKAQTPTLSQVNAFSPSGFFVVGIGVFGDYLYAFGATGSQACLVKYNANGLSYVANYTDLDDLSGGLSGSGQRFGVVGDYAYICVNFYNTSASLWEIQLQKIQLSDMTLVTDSPGYVSSGAFSCFCTDGTYLYCYQSTGYIIKFDSNMNVVANSTVDVNNQYGNCNNLQYADGRICGSCADSYVFELNPSGLATINVSDQLAGSPYEFFFGDSSIYCDVWGESGSSIVKLSYADFSQVGLWNESTIGQGASDGDDFSFSICKGYLAIGCTPDDPHLSVICLDPSSLSFVCGISDQEGYDGANAVCSSGNYIYAEYGNNGGLIVQYELSSSSPTPTPTHHGGGGGSDGSFTTPIPSASVSPSSSPVSVSSAISGWEIFGIAMTVAVLFAVFLHYLLPQPKKRR